MQEAPIIQKIYDFYQLFYVQIDHLPKKSRVVLTPKIEKQILKLLELSAKAAAEKPDNKTKYLNEASSCLDLLKIYIRLLYDLKLINQSKNIELQTVLQEIGRMLGGWIKSVK
jgi:hypothetical protein